MRAYFKAIFLLNLICWLQKWSCSSYGIEEANWKPPRKLHSSFAYVSLLLLNEQIMTHSHMRSHRKYSQIRCFFFLQWWSNYKYRGKSTAIHNIAHTHLHFRCSIYLFKIKLYIQIDVWCSQVDKYSWVDHFVSVREKCISLRLAVDL